MKTKEYTSWETIQKMYPDRFVLLENPVFVGTGPVIKEGIFLYKHKSYKKVVEKDLELKPSHSTIDYTGGIRGDRAGKMAWVL
jgi:hypothetical protein